MPRERSKGTLLDLPASCALPDLARLDGREPMAEVRVAWNPRGIGVAVELSGKVGPVAALDPDTPDLLDGIQVWVDTRNTRDIHRASRFCHRFKADLIPNRGGDDLAVRLDQKPIPRALTDAPRCPPELLKGRGSRIRAGWRLEVFLPAEALHGFDPETNRRLGFMVQVTDPDRGDQFLGVGREFPVGEDPSLWSTLELRDDDG